MTGEWFFFALGFGVLAACVAYRIGTFQQFKEAPRSIHPNEAQWALLLTAYWMALIVFAISGVYSLIRGLRGWRRAGHASRA